METDFFWPDLVILSIIVFSIIVSFIRGFIKELISLVSWVVAAWIALLLAKPISSLFTFTEVESIRYLVAFLMVFIGMVFLGALVNFVVGKLIRKTPFSLPDRILGVGFGLIRGTLIITLIVMIAGLTPIPKDKWWQKSYTIGQFETVAIWVRSKMPKSMQSHFVFSDEIDSTQEGEPQAEPKENE